MFMNRHPLIRFLFFITLFLLLSKSFSGSIIVITPVTVTINKSINRRNWRFYWQIRFDYPTISYID